MAGHVPARGEVLNHENGFLFRVLDADARHIRRVRVRRLTPQSEETTPPHPASPA
jgi:Mg2+/Co2+ transporter CorC